MKVTRVLLNLALVVLASGSLLSGNLYGLDEHEAGVFGKIASCPLQLCDISRDTSKDVSQMNIYFYSPGNRTCFKYAIKEAAREMQSNPKFNEKLPCVFIIAGFNTEHKRFAPPFIEAFQTENMNIIFLDHYVYTCAGFIEFLSYNKMVSFYLHPIAWTCAHFLAELLECGLCLEDLHVLGHSFGAQVMGATACDLRKLTNKCIPRCTGLDPCGPCFNTKPSECIKSGNCDHVDCYYSNMGQMGTTLSLCDANYFINGIISTQPGCGGNGDVISKLNPNMICSHLRCIDVYLESVRNRGSCSARRCPCDEDFKEGRCSGNEVVSCGYNPTSNVKGKFFFWTNAEPNFLVGPDGANPCKKNVTKKCLLSDSLL